MSDPLEETTINAGALGLLSPFKLTAPSFAAENRVASFRGREQASYPFRFDVDITVHDTDAPGVAALLGTPATLELQLPNGDVRRVCGVVVAIDAATALDRGRQRQGFRMRLAPRLSLLQYRRTSRIFQEQTVPEIVGAVLDAAHVPHRSSLVAKYKERVYCVQYQETDLAFVTRVLAEEGIFYFFEHGDDGETVVLGDSAAAYVPIAGDPKLAYRAEREGLLPQESHVGPFVRSRALQTGSVLHRDYDFRRPKLDLRAASKAADAIKGERDLGVYDHELDDETPVVDATTARLRLEQHRRHADLARGGSACRRLFPGATFELMEHEVGAADGTYVVERIDHQGRSPAFASKLERIYENTFRCRLADAALRPKRPPRRLQQVTETAVVVGPKGQEIYTDENGRVKVQFPWDLRGKHDDHSSCWIRVSQAWAGSGWGFQFIPRVGMEVVVAFLGGDVDRPLITGCVANAMNPLPFALPGSPTMSGIRTQSTPGGHGANQLSFQDQKGSEEILLAAQRDLRETIGNDRTTTVANNDAVTLGNRTSEIARTDTTTIGKGRTTTVGGEDSLTVHQNRTVTVLGGMTEVIQGRSTLVHQENLVTMLGGHVISMSDGKPGAPPGSYASHSAGTWTAGSDDTVKLIAAKRIVLECGESSLILTPDGVKIRAKELLLVGRKAASFMGGEKAQGPALHLTDKRAEIASKKIRIFTADASLDLEKNADLRGVQVRLNCDDRIPDTQRATEPLEETKPFSFKVSDEAFEPYAGKRYELVMGGKKYAGTVGGDGSIHETVPKDATDGAITVWVDDYPTGRRKNWAITAVEALPPATSLDGSRARLRNLGYDVGVGNELDDITRDALREFQNDHDLPVTGKLDAATVAQLGNRHGH